MQGAFLLEREKTMINALHLLWIIPLAASFGFVIAAIMTAAKE
jgi:hypothetical protein